VFGLFGGKKKDEPEEEEEIEPVSFLGPLDGQEVNLKANGRLVEAGLMRAKDLVTDALARRADTIRIEPKGPQAVVTILVDGMPYPAGKLAKAEGMAITEFEAKPYTLGIKSIPVADGERLVVRVTDSKIKLETPTELGMGEPMRLKLREMCSEPGILLVVGPPGSGTTTTLFAVLKNIDAYIFTIFTLADYEGRKVQQVTALEREPNEELEATIAKAARREANVLLCEAVKADATAKSMFAKHESILMLAEMAAKDTSAAVMQLIEWVGDAKLVSEGLKGIVTQKLIRTLCPDCRLAYKPKADFLKKLGLPEETPALYRKPPEPAEGSLDEPCEKCGAIGYFGRTGMFEFLEATEGMRAVIAGKPDANSIRSQMKKDKMTTLQQDGLRLVAEGRTSLEELQRVFKPA
jgi:type IV pilus assembly protein PilB